MSTLATDNFNRADSNTLGSNWTANSGMNQPSIVSNAATFPSGSSGNDCGAYYNAVTWPADQYSQAKIFTTSSATDGSGGGVYGRLTTGANTGYRLVVTTTRAELARFNAGSFTLIWNRVVSFTSGSTLRLEVTGSATVTLRAYINGTQIGADSTDSSASRVTSGNAGLAYSSIDSSWSADDWEGGDFSGGTVTPGQLVLDNIPIFQLRKVVAY